MTDEEIKAVVSDTPSAFKRTPQIGAAEVVWKAVERLGTQVDAADELGLTQAGVQAGLRRYMEAHGIEGPLPGKLTPEQLAARRRAARASIPTKTVEIAEPPADLHTEATSAIVKGLRAQELAVAEGKTTPLAAAFERAAETVRTDAAMRAPARSALRPAHGEIPIAIVHMGDSEAHAKSYSEGYDDGYLAGQNAKVEDVATDALIDWLKTYGPGWTQREAERWFKALTATIDLIYPTRVEGAIPAEQLMADAS